MELNHLNKTNGWRNIYILLRKNNSENDFERDFYQLLSNAIYCRTKENVRNQLRLDFIKKYEYRYIIKEQSKLAFAGIHKSYENCDSYLLKKNELKMDKPIYLGLDILEISEFHLYETYYNKLQPYFGQESLQLHYIDTDVFLLSMNTSDIIKDLKNFESIFDFSNLDENHELFSSKNIKVI